VQGQPDDRLTVPVGRVRPTSWRGPLIAAGIAGAVIGLGFMGTPGPNGALPRETAPASPLQPVPAVAVALLAPSAGAILDTGRVRVEGTATPGTQPLEIRLLVADVMVGRTAVSPANGAFAVDVPLLAPYGGDPVAATLEVSVAGIPGDPIVRREVTVRPAAVVTVHEVSFRTRGGASSVVLTGSAALDVRRVTVVIDRGGARVTGEAPVAYRNDADFVEAVLGFGAGEWAVTVPVSFAPGPATITVSWDGRETGGETVLDVDLRA
jgi:hypothetical protein